MMQNSTALPTSQQQQQQQQQQQIKCPRCDSTNTKFSYYNNYNLSQPRHYCKSCRRYWTLGGALRDVPVGGGSRKSSKRSKHSLNSSPEPLELNLITADTMIDQDERMLDINESFTSLLSSGGHFTELLDGFSFPNSSSLSEFDSNVFELQNSSDTAAAAANGANDKPLQHESLLGLHGWWMS